MTTPLNVSRPRRPPQQRYPECAVQGCGRTPRAFSRYCSDHARNYHRTRDPNGRAIRASEIKQYLNHAEVYLERFSDHGAVQAAEKFLEVTLTDPSMPAAIRKHMLRLSRDGVQPRQLLVSFLGVWGLRHYLPHTVTNDSCEAFNIGNRVLRTSPLPTFRTAAGKPYSARLPARVAEAYGVMLRQALGFFATQFWGRVQRELDAHYDAAKAVSNALRATPLLDSPANP